jgi:uncharacterized membrane protein YedE/YeeE
MKILKFFTAIPAILLLIIALALIIINTVVIGVALSSDFILGFISKGINKILVFLHSELTKAIVFMQSGESVQ